MMATPTKPMTTPASLPRVIFSSLVRKWANRTVKSGVEAFRIEATAEAICCCPQTIREKGMALFSNPIPKNAIQTLRSVGNRSARNFRANSRISAARPTRETTIVKTGNSRTATPLKKKEPPQSTASAISIAHSDSVMGRDDGDDCGMIFLRREWAESPSPKQCPLIPTDRLPFFAFKLQ